MPSRTLERLEQLHDLFADERRWTKGIFAQNAEGADVSDPTSVEACKWCLLGGVMKVCGLSSTWMTTLETRGVEQRLRQALPSGFVNVHGVSITSFNDKSTHDAVVLLIDRAIALEKEGMPT